MSQIKQTSTTLEFVDILLNLLSQQNSVVSGQDFFPLLGNLDWQHGNWVGMASKPGKH